METPDFSNEGVILVLGVTGSGKSYFLNKLKSGSVTEGHGLKSETAQCQAVQILLDEEDGKDRRSITVIDTPGFDDTNRPQSEILAEIAEFLATQHALRMPLRGVLYLHKITDNKMTGSSLTYLNLLKSLVGEDALGNVVLVTSMWNRLRDEDYDQALKREQELIDDYWGPMQKKGSYVDQFDGTTESALSLVYQLAGKESVVLEVQKEIMDKDASILGTSAGMDLAMKLKQDIEAYQSKVGQLEQELQRELQVQPRDEDRVRALREAKVQVEKLLELVEESMESMNVRPASSIRERIMGILKEKRTEAIYVLTTALHLTFTIVFGV